MAKYEIQRSLIVSTAHITLDMSIALHNNKYGIRHGYDIHVDAGMDMPTISETVILNNLLTLAKDNDCTHLVLDMDGTIHDELPSWEW